ncbi:phosphoglycerate mutase-like protein 4 isoform X1 [Apium graveolens]|uniref:phosphoglycerate mutase-like protein 4 isoform X1 n=1 Tax=Apium graveolens TaxID=4045 RepID=UPI003D7C137D
MATASISSDGDVESAGFNYAEIIVIRHGETEWNANGRIQGHLEVGLNDNGRLQSAAVAERLSKEPKVSAIYSSDLRRALDTAEIIATSCGGLEVIKDPALRERHSGDLQGIVRHEAAMINPKAHKASLSRCKDQEIPGGGESINQLNQRCTSCLQSIGDKHRGERVVVVTHGGVMRALHKRAYPHEHAKKVWTTSVSVFHLSDDDEWNIKLWGDVSHFKKSAV